MVYKGWQKNSDGRFLSSKELRPDAKLIQVKQDLPKNTQTKTGLLRNYMDPVLQTVNEEDYFSTKLSYSFYNSCRLLLKAHLPVKKDFVTLCQRSPPSGDISN